jgi:DNA-binding NarL/FixJ family response regulator
MSPIRVLIADDHPLFRDGMHGLLDSVAETEVVGEACDGREAVRLARRLGPDVVLMDLNMPNKNGIEATREILTRHPGVGVLVLTMFEDDDSVFAAMRAGARGYLLKGADGDDTLRAIRAVARGEAILGPSAARRLASFFAGRPPTPAFPELTEREREVLDLIARGYTNDAIAKRLYLSPKTARNYVSAVFQKLGVADRAGAIVRAREAGLGRDGGAHLAP